MIIVARDVLFRIYGGLLSYHSPIFADIHAKARDPQNSDNVPMFEGCPVVSVSDTPEDMRCFLKLLHDCNYSTSEEFQTDPLITLACMRLSTKYAVVTDVNIDI